MNGAACLFEPAPVDTGDVLASIRRLIAQEDAGPDFAQPVRRLDAAGNIQAVDCG